MKNNLKVVFIFSLGCLIYTASKASAIEQISWKDIEGFSAHAVTVISDGDVYAQSYLGKPIPTYKSNMLQDQVSIEYREKPGHLFSVTNSVVGTPEIIASSPDGSYSVIVETRGQRKPGDKTIADLKMGAQVTLIELTSKTITKHAYKVPFVPLSVDISNNGKFVAVAGVKANKGKIAIFKKTKNALTQVHHVDVDNFLPNEGISSISLVQWHPKKSILALHLFRQNKILFIKSPSWKKVTQWKVWGDAVAVGEDPFVGRFTKQGDRYIAANWNRNFQAKDIYGRLPKDFSSVSVIKLSNLGNVHKVIQNFRVPASPEGIAISKDGSKLAIISMQNSLYAVEKPNLYSPNSTVSFYSIPAKSNMPLSQISTCEFEGILPEGGSFDLSGEFFAATVFQDKAKESQSGKIHFFKVLPGESMHIGYQAVAHGAHHILIR